MQIVPLDPYHIIYSAKVRDFLDIVVELDQMSEEAVCAWLDEKDYTRISDLQLIDNSFLGEVMVLCEQYEAILVEELN